MSCIQAQEPEIILFRGWPSRGCYVWSPFVTKVESRLRFAAIRYSIEAGSPRSAPKGKIPYIECRTEARTTAIGDSTLIARELVQSGLLPDLNSDLDPEKFALDLSLRSLFEDKLYFYGIKEKWIDNYYTMRDHVLWAIPTPLRAVIGLFIYRSQIAMLHSQGTGRFTDEEIAGLKREIWGTLDSLLAVSRSKVEKGPFWVLGGVAPTEVDTTVYGFVVGAMITTAGPASRAIIQEFPHVLEYATRIHAEYFRDYNKWEEDQAKSRDYLVTSSRGKMPLKAFRH